jgi:hypothetical protein
MIDVIPPVQLEMLRSAWNANVWFQEFTTLPPVWAA